MDVEVIGVHKQYSGGSAAALNGISFVAESGRITSLVGASGCGKTTTLRCIAGLETIDQGEIRFGTTVVAIEGRSIVPIAQRNIGMVFQSYALWPHLTVAQNIAFGLKTRGWKKARIEQRIQEILTLINLPGFGDRYPAQLSGGQQQRVAVGRALAYEPELLLLDEPLANLDSHLRAQMRQEIRLLQRKTGVTMVYVTHDRAEAMELSDRIVILDGGGVVQTGSPAELFEQPADSLVARFLGHANFVPAELIETQNGRVAVQTPFGRCWVPGESPAQAITLLARVGAIQFAARDEPPQGWLAGQGKVLTISQASEGSFCTFATTGGTLEFFVPQRYGVGLDDELAFHIDPDKCQLVALRAGNA